MQVTILIEVKKLADLCDRVEWIAHQLRIGHMKGKGWIIDEID